MPVVEVVDDVHAAQDGVAEGEEALARGLGGDEHESADLLGAGPVEVLGFVCFGVIDGDDELAGGDGDGDFAGELDGQAVVGVAVFAVAEALGVDVREQGEDSLLVVLDWEGPG